MDKLSDKLSDKMAVMEAVFFMSPRPLSIRRLMKSIGVHRGEIVKGMIEQLNRMYEERNSALRIFEVNGKYIMNILPAYADYVVKFTTETELTKSEMKVLAYIAKHDGIIKSKLVKRLGSVYDKIKSLEEKGYVKEMPEGRSSKLFVTKKFKEYFGEL